MDAPALLDLEIDLLLEAVYRRWGYDFRDYARASLRRRIELVRQELGTATLGELQHRVLHERPAFDRLAYNLSVCVTELFRDHPFYKVLVDKVLPILASHPFIKVWHAGCATGEEVYSGGAVRQGGAAPSHHLLRHRFQRLLARCGPGRHLPPGSPAEGGRRLPGGGRRKSLARPRDRRLPIGSFQRAAAPTHGLLAAQSDGRPGVLRGAPGGLPQMPKATSPSPIRRPNVCSRPRTFWSARLF
jgi:hypothetical protein